MLPEIHTPVPGPRSRTLMEKLRRYESRNVTYTDAEFPVFWERAEGVNVWDADGNRYLDLVSAFGVCGLGHRDPAIMNAITAQAGQLWHAMGDVHPAAQKAELCEQLGRITFERWGAGRGKVILGNSGFEAVEAALKTSLLHSGKPGVIYFRGGYHGLGYGALEVGGHPVFRKPFRGQLARFGVEMPYPFCRHCPMGVKEDYRLEGGQFPNCSSQCLLEIEKRIAEAVDRREIGAILVEPMQGRGGEIVPPRDFLPMLRRICDERKILLICDEILTGFHRTGKWFACEHFGVIPDIICLGKGLTGGFPLSACVGRADVMDAWPESDGAALHTSTYLGHPAGCAAALASIARHEDPQTEALVARTSKTLHQHLEKLRGLDAVRDVRGLGMLFGVELPDAETAVALVKAALRDGLIFLPSGMEGNVLSICPPFALTEEEIAFACRWLQEYLISRPGSIS